MSELQGWIQVGLGAFGVMVAVVGVVVDVVLQKPKSPPEGGDCHKKDEDQ